MINHFKKLLKNDSNCAVGRMPPGAYTHREKLFHEMPVVSKADSTYLKFYTLFFMIKVDVQDKRGLYSGPGFDKMFDQEGG